MTALAHFDPDDKLASLGIEVDATGAILFCDLERAKSCYVHHSSQPTALAAFSVVSPVLSRGRFPNYTFIELLRKRPSVAEVEILAFQAVCGAALELPEGAGGMKFFTQRVNVLDELGLKNFSCSHTDSTVPRGRSPLHPADRFRP